MAAESLLKDEDAARDDRALEALVTLSDTAEASIEQLNQVQRQLADARRRRRRGWSWRRIVGAADTESLFPSLARITANLARSSGQFRRAIALALRSEGARVNEVANNMQVTRQRVSALTRSRNRE